MGIIKSGKVDFLEYVAFETRQEMGEYSARLVSEEILRLLTEKESINMIFAAAPSQSDFLSCLVADVRIPWDRINAFHMDEYIGLSEDAPQGFGNFLKKAIFDLVPFKSVNLMDSTASDPESECARYGELIKNFPCDIVVMGIGENGHIAFNDPHAASFCDQKIAKTVTLDNTCRMQQVNDGCFENIGQVPTCAITLTVPALMSAGSVFCIVPAKTKAEAVKNTLLGEITEKCPATALRHHKNAKLFLDSDSARFV